MRIAQSPFNLSFSNQEDCKEALGLAQRQPKDCRGGFQVEMTMHDAICIRQITSSLAACNSCYLNAGLSVLCGSSHIYSPLGNFSTFLPVHHVSIEKSVLGEAPLCLDNLSSSWSPSQTRESGSNQQGLQVKSHFPICCPVLCRAFSSWLVTRFLSRL